MGRVFFFIAEGLRALRRSAAPSAAAIVTVAVTMLLLGVLIPVLQTTEGKNDEVRDQVGLRVFLNDDRHKPPIPQDQIDELHQQLQGITHVESVELVTQEEGLKSIQDDFQAKSDEDLTGALGGDNPLPTSFNVKPDD